MDTFPVTIFKSIPEGCTWGGKSLERHKKTCSMAVIGTSIWFGWKPIKKSGTVSFGKKHAPQS
jgi:hypothetical protein